MLTHTHSHIISFFPDLFYVENWFYEQLRKNNQTGARGPHVADFSSQTNVGLIIKHSQEMRSPRTENILTVILLAI